MPDGVMKWFDSKTGKAEVVRGGRLFPARAHDIETPARRAGARVHFDIRRVHGVEEAVAIRLREGARVSRHQHDFGTLAGARRADTKGAAPYAQVHPELRAAVSHPLEVARAWASALSVGDIPGTMSLYSPDALLHVEQESISGRRSIHGWLETCPVLGSARHARIHGSDQLAVICWEGVDQAEPGLVVSCRITHAQIAEQWMSEPVPERYLSEGQPRAFDVALSTKGDVGAEAKKRAQEELLRLVEKLSEPVLFARVKLAFEPDPARPRPALAQVSLDIDGDHVRAQVAAHTAAEAIDLLVSRLEDQLEHRAQRREHLHRLSTFSEAGEWRHGAPRKPRPPYFDRPTEERQLVRHKMFVVDELSPDEAIFDMDQLDYDFYLFCDLASGSDGVIERLEDGSYRLTRLHPSEMDPGPIAAALEISDTPAAVLSLEEAMERLDASGEPHVFFADSATGRANVVYRRYDGHYGLITPE